MLLSQTNFIKNNSNINNNIINYNTFLRKKHSENMPKNSLTILEDEYWRLILESHFISSLKIPVTYIKLYSNEINDFYLEKLYDYLIKWLVDRYVDEEQNKIKSSNNNKSNSFNQLPINQNDNFRTEFSEDIHLDDSDCIKFRYSLNIIMKVVMNANIMNKQKCLIDFYMLTIYNRDNCVVFLNNKYFHQWLLDLMLPYQILILNEKFKHSTESGIAFTILDLGSKIHTAIIINSIFNDKHYENESSILKAFNFILTWGYKIKTLGVLEGEAASYLIRNIFHHLIKILSEHLRLMSPSVKAPMWHYFLHLTFVIYEFIFYSNFYKKILEKKIIFDHLEKNEIFAEIIQNLNYDLNQEKAEGRHSCGNVSMMDLWLDKELLMSLYECYKVIWKQINLKMFITEKQSFFNFNINIGGTCTNKDQNSNPAKIKNNESNKINNFIGNNQNYQINESSNNLNGINKSMNNQSQLYNNNCIQPNNINFNSNNAKNNIRESEIEAIYNSEEIKSLEFKINKLIFETNSNYYLEDLKLFMFTQNNFGNSQNEKICKNNLMRVILNSLIILIMLSESYEEIQTWLDELEKYISFVIIASENSRLDSKGQNSNEIFLSYQQECVAEILIIVFYFLSDEIKSPRREKSSDKILKLFKNTLKFLFISVCLIIEKNDIIFKEITKNKDSIFSNYIKTFKNMLYLGGKTVKYFSASYKIFSEYLINQSKNKLFDINDIQNWKSSGFSDLVELFNDENWIFAFQENSISFEIIKNQFQFNLYETIINLKLMEAQNIIINNEIGVKEKLYINQLYRSISSSIRESLINIEKFLKNEIFKIFFKKKKLEYNFYKIQKSLFLLKGAWSKFNFCDFPNNSKNLNSDSDNPLSYSFEIPEQLIAKDFFKFKVSSHISATLSRNVLYPILNIKNYLPLFSKYLPQNLFLDEDSNKRLHIQNNFIDNLNSSQIKNNFGILDVNYENPDLEESSNNNSKTINIEECEKNYINKKGQVESKPKDIKKDVLGEISILKVKQITNKSNMFYKNIHYSDFIDKYTNIEKLTKYFRLFYEKDFKLIIINLTEFLIKKLKEQNPNSHVFEVCMVKVSGHKSGKIIINKDNIIFIRNNFDFFQQENKIEEKCIESLFKSKEKRGQKFFLKINIQSVKQIYKRRLFYKNNSLEIFLFKNRSYFFKFNNQNDRDFFCKTAYDYCCQKFNLFLFEFHIDIKKNIDLLDKVKKEWIEWGMSNFDFLMNLNNMAGRSYHDLTQYPVFPWVIGNYKTQAISLKLINNNNFQEYLRDLSKPIGALGSEDRKEIYLQNFKESCISYETFLNSISNLNSNINNSNNFFKNNNLNSNPINYNNISITKELNDNSNFNNNFNSEKQNQNYKNLEKIEFNDGKYFYSSHYSNPFYVTNFLARIFPYTYCAIELQGEGFDNPNRQFISISKAFENCMTQSTDIRELIPEFFYLPEFLMNNNKVNFGKITENGDEDLIPVKENDLQTSIDIETFEKINRKDPIINPKKIEKYLKSNFVQNVEIPIWGKDPCYFVYINKIILESQFISNKLNEWIDLIFGAKQRGKEAENAMNLFWNYTYEDEIDIDYIKERDYEEYLSYISKVEFGQTPIQLFRNIFASRNKKELTKRNKIFIENKNSMKIFRSTSESSNHFRNRKETIKNMIVKIKSLENNKLLCVYNNGTVKMMK